MQGCYSAQEKYTEQKTKGPAAEASKSTEKANTQQACLSPKGSFEGCESQASKPGFG